MLDDKNIFLVHGFTRLSYGNNVINDIISIIYNFYYSFDDKYIILLCNIGTNIGGKLIEFSIDNDKIINTIESDIWSKNKIGIRYFL